LSSYRLKQLMINCQATFCAPFKSVKIGRALLEKSNCENLLKILNSNTTSGYEIAGNFRSQIRVFVSATIFTSERSEQVKIVLRVV
jgi:hypothetical protein